MTIPIVQYAFTGGELSPTLWGRTDLEKYDLGCSKAYNMFVDYRGGLSSRTGLEYAVEVTNPEDTTRIFSFDFGVDIANTYILVFGDTYLRFIQDGGYVLEDAVSITGATAADPGVITAASHGYTTGDLVFIDAVEGMTELNNRLFVITVLSTDTFSLQEVYDDTLDVDTSAYTAYTSGGDVYRVYTVTTPYAEGDLDSLVLEQRRDTVICTHPDYAPQELVRSGATDWAIGDLTIASSVATPENLSGSASGAGSATVGYVITTIIDGEESLPTRMEVLTSIVNFTTEEGQVVLTWDSVDDADYYRIYRTTVNPASTAVQGAEITGYIGVAYAPTFTDGNIVPDFADTPPEFYDPFADGAIEHINITAGGSGYDQDTAEVSITGDGSGFEGYPIVDNSGAIVGVYILQAGSGYTTATVSFTGGSSATATATIGAASGNNPRTSKIFQQRQIFGGTDNSPLGVWGSKPGSYRNFDSSLILTDGDSYEFDLDAERVNPIRYFIALQRNLIAFTGSGVWNITGGDDVAVTPLNVNAEAQTYIGSDDVKPIAIDNDILYVQKENGVVRALAYNRVSDIYTGVDRSLFSNHFFTKQRTIVRWAWAQTPFYLIWCVRSDGRILTMTWIKEQEVYGWTQHETQGLAKDVASIEENGQNIPYFVIQREVNSNTRKFIERITRREGDNAEDYMCFDAGYSTGPTAQDGTASASAATGTVTVTVSGATPFTSADVGSDIRINNGRIRITAYSSSTEVTGDVKVELTDLLPDGTPLPTTDWSMDAQFTTISGLWHLEGSSVTTLANGTPQSAQTVTNGQVTVPSGTTLAHVGWGYTWELQTLPAIMRDRIIEGKTRSPVSADLRLNLARGVYLGTDEDNLYFVVEPGPTAYDTAIPLQSGIRSQAISSTYDKDAIVTVRGTLPLPATVLGYTLNMDVGDDDDRS